MSVRKLVLLSLCVAVILSGSTVIALHLWRSATPAPTPMPTPILTAMATPATGGPAAAPGAQSGPAYAYVTEDKLVVRRPAGVVAEVKRLSDSADSGGHKTIWTHSGTHVAMLSDAAIRQDDPADIALLLVDARTGAVQRSPCPHCDDITPVAENSVLAMASDPDGARYHFLRFDIGVATSGIPSDLPLPQGGMGSPALLVSSRSQVIVSKYVDGLMQLSLAAIDGSLNRVIGRFTSNEFMPAAVSGGDDGTGTVFAVAFRTNPGSCGPFPIWLFDARGGHTRTDMPNAAPGGSATDTHGLLVNDLWWGPDGHFHASIDTLKCENSDEADSVTTTTASAVWRLDGTVWVQQRKEPTIAARQLDAGTRVVLAPHNCKDRSPGQDGYLTCWNTGALYQEKIGRRTPVADNVIALSAPSPVTASVPAAPLPTTAVAADTNSDRSSSRSAKTNTTNRACHRCPSGGGGEAAVTVLWCTAAGSRPS